MPGRGRRGFLLSLKHPVRYPASLAFAVTIAAKDAAEVEGAKDGRRHGWWQGPQEGQCGFGCTYECCYMHTNYGTLLWEQHLQESEYACSCWVGDLRATARVNPQRMNDIAGGANFACLRDCVLPPTLLA